MNPGQIRNFSIIAHIDHGKSTLADRLLLQTGAISEREFRDQILDDMDLERERGITIKASAVRLNYQGNVLNLIDTPGHVDFCYEVSKSLAAVEGVLLLVDATQGIEAQTLANFHLAREKHLLVIPVVSKVDLPSARPEDVALEISRVLKIDQDKVLFASGKTGEGVEEILQTVLRRVPPPEGQPGKPLRALIFDSKYDSYKGVIIYVRVMDGEMHAGDTILLMQNGTVHEVTEIGVFNPRPQNVDSIGCGEVGYFACNIKNVADVKIGDTVTHQHAPAESPLPGYKEVKPMVFCGLYPVNARDYGILRDALDKLRLNDASFVYEPESSVSLGFGYRCGFLGLLHMDIIQERLEREFNLDLIATAPNVVYRVSKTNGESFFLDNPTKLPSPQELALIEEPFIRAEIICPTDCLGTLMQLCQDRRGVYKSTEYLDMNRALLHYELPFSEVLLDFYDKIKSMTRGYGSFNYDFLGYRKGELVRMDVLINGEIVDALSSIVIRENAYHRGKILVEKLREVIPRQLFEVAIQAA
ncbi:MAG TPA: translation elongation factor 4, partial [Candidatus Omnitrophota bacterium]|nr:translation elongation factor 4 [Candidatus Omnitrophota bacterium]